MPGRRKKRHGPGRKNGVVWIDEGQDGIAAMATSEKRRVPVARRERPQGVIRYSGAGMNSPVA